jgi:cell division protein FtsZ
MAKSQKVKEAFNKGGSNQLLDGYTNKIKIIGLGSTGCNIVNYLYNKQNDGVDFVVCVRNEKLIERIRVPNKIRLINQVALDIEQPLDLVDLTICDTMMDSRTEVVLIHSETGETTHSTIAAGIARVAQEKGIITVGIVLIPLFTEANEVYLDIDKFCRLFDSSIVIVRNKSNKSKTITDVDSNLLKMNEAVVRIVKGITAIILQYQFEIKEIRTVLCNNNSIFAGFSVASGKDRGKKAIVTALSSPYVKENIIVNVKHVLLLITSGTIALTVDEIGEVSDYLQAAAGYNASITIVVSEDMKLGESLSIAIIAS